MIHLAKAVQLLGMAIVLTGLLIGLGRDDIRTELAMLGGGGVVFVVGKMVLERRAP